MPPQQAHRLLNIINYSLDFCAHKTQLIFDLKTGLSKLVATRNQTIKLRSGFTTRDEFVGNAILEQTAASSVKVLVSAILKVLKNIAINTNN